MPISLDHVLILLILLAALVLFAFEVVRAELVALSAMVALMVLGLVTPQEGISGFSNPATITILALFVVSAGVYKTGLVDAAARRLVGLVGGSEVRALVLIFLVAAPASMFLNNTAIVAILLPFTITLAENSRTSRSKLLMPLSQIAMLAGTVTVIGTSTNVLASGLLAERTGEGFGMFEFAKVGLVALAVGAAYILLFGRHLIPARIPAGTEGEQALLRAFLTEARVQEGSPLVGPVAEARERLARARIEVVRMLHQQQDVGDEVKAGDLIVLRAARKDLAHVEQDLKVDVLDGIAPADVSLDANALVEVVLAPNSSLVRRNLEDNDFAREFGVRILGLHKLRPEWIPQVSRARLEFGDTLLLLADKAAIERMRKDPDLLVIEELPAYPLRARKATLAVAIAASVVTAAAIGLVPILTAALAGALVMVLSGILKPDELWTSVRWDVIFLMAGMIPLGIAIESSGLAAIIAHWLVGVAGGLPDLGILLVFYTASMLLTALLSNSGNIVLLTPIAFAVASAASLDPRPLVLAVMFASSNDFNTPIGYQTNLMVYGPGGYKFLDYVRTGGPLSIVLALATSLAILMWFPLR